MWSTMNLKNDDDIDNDDADSDEEDYDDNNDDDDDDDDFDEEEDREENYGGPGSEGRMVVVQNFKYSSLTLNNLTLT